MWNTHYHPFTLCHPGLDLLSLVHAPDNHHHHLDRLFPRPHGLAIPWPFPQSFTSCTTTRVSRDYGHGGHG